MDSDDIQASKQHGMMRRSKGLALKEGRVKTNRIGTWRNRTSGKTYKVYEKEYVELGCFEWWLKDKANNISVIYSFDFLIRNFERIDKLRGK